MKTAKDAVKKLRELASKSAPSRQATLNLAADEIEQAMKAKPITLPPPDSAD